MSAATPIWVPSAEAVEEAELTRFARWLERERGVRAGDYRELWQWSVDDLEGFWRVIWDYFEVISEAPPQRALASREMPGAEWFPGTRLNFAEHVFRDREDSEPAILSASELRPLERVSWGELRAEVARVAAGLRALGVGEGDRVVAYMPNIAETAVAFLATASLGAVWSSASPEFGEGSVVDRFAQIEPKVLIACDGYRYGGRDFPRLDAVARLRERLPSLQRTVLVRYLGAAGEAAGALAWEELGAGAPGAAELGFARVPFSAPLWVLYSSGTTGLPKAIVQSQGGILLEQLKNLHLHYDLRASDRFFWFTTTGWMMWNVVVSGLLTKAPVVLFDGNPGYPDLGRLWDLAAEAGVTVFGTSAAFVAASRRAGVEPAAGRELRVRALGSTGSPLAPEGFDWLYEQLGERLWLFSTSGGTDVCTSFVGGVATLPVYRGELQAPALGVALAAFDPEGRPLVGEVGELVVTAPMPSMPVFFWGDEDGSRYREAYFEMYPGVWRHGDWIEVTEWGTAVIHGRSDSTINRGGVRIGTAEIYRALDRLPEVADALVVDLPREGGDGWIALFVVLREGAELDEELRKRMARAVREHCSPRHVPDAAFEIAAVPRTLSGKALEVPVKRILMGADPERAVSRGSLANPEALDVFVELARHLAEE